MSTKIEKFQKFQIEKKELISVKGSGGVTPIKPSTNTTNNGSSNPAPPKGDGDGNNPGLPIIIPQHSS